MTSDEIAKKVTEDIERQLKANRGEAEVKPEPKDEPIKVAPVVIKAGQRSILDVLGSKSTTIRDFAVTVFKQADWHPTIRAFVPEVDPEYVVQESEAAIILEAWENGEKSLITGPTGSGKSSLIKHLCALTQRPFIRINMNGDIESSALFGQIVVEDGATIWKDGAVTEGTSHGAVILIDEWELMPPEIGMSMQCLLEDKGFLFLKEKPGSSEDKMIRPHKDTRLVYAGNTVGQGDENGSFAGVAVQNTATIDRFQTTVVLDYLTKEHETNVLKSTVAGLPDGQIRKMLQYADLVRTANRQGNMALTMSPRTLINWGRKMVRMADNKVALTIAFWNKLSSSDKKLAMDIYTKVFGR